MHRTSSIASKKRVTDGDVVIGQRMRQRRLECDISQDRLAEILGVAFQQVQKYEKGVNRMSATRLFDVSKALNVPIGFFFDASPPVFETGDRWLDSVLATDDGVALLRHFASIDLPSRRRQVVAVVRVLAQRADD